MSAAQSGRDLGGVTTQKIGASYRGGAGSSSADHNQMLTYSPHIHGVLWPAEKIKFRKQGPGKRALQASHDA